MTNSHQPHTNSGKTAVAGTEERERRSQRDRRYERTTHPLAWRSWTGRRRSSRREEDNVDIFVDRYPSVLRYICAGILLLSFTDAFFTLRILERGGSELNPVMEYLIGSGVHAFVYTKLALTALGLVVLVSYFHFRWFRIFKVAHLVYAYFGFYLVLINYEIFLLVKSYHL